MSDMQEAEQRAVADLLDQGRRVLVFEALRNVLECKERGERIGDFRREDVAWFGDELVRRLRELDADPSLMSGDSW